ncbi:histidine phosphatase family protein [Kineosporia sp. J2-2]|uniref:Histidine phosphatase family protein n=1 Tax=Kineosporia corallincola TaxID=2835133 RepID=A0ABS5TMS3_9ACTN|nr:histidine phosphatase family protein [Kineosporia corallincola]MBT0772398.1 histidine phosphatase family protein [Kineosporia corallincola]
MSTGPTRRLILIRHAKAEQPAPGQADADRPLAHRGLLDAAVAGQELARIAVPGVVVCSPARRTRQTWRAVLEGLTTGLGEMEDDANHTPHPDVRYVPALYEASTFDVVETVRQAGTGGGAGDPGVIVVVGHEPVMSEATLALSGPGSDPDAVQRVKSGFPTAGIAVLAVEREWAALAPGDGRLERFVVPRSEDGGSIG